MFIKFLSYYKPHRRKLALVLSFVVLFTLLELMIPLLSREILNVLIPQKQFNMILKLGLVMLIITLFLGLFHYLVGYFGHMLGISIENDMRIKAFEKLQLLSFDYYDSHKTGVIMTRLTADLHAVGELAHHGIEEVVSVVLILTLGYLYLIQFDFWITSLLFVIFIVSMVLLMYSRRNMIHAFRLLRHEHAEINSRLESNISGIRLTRAFTNEPYEIKRFKKDNIKYMGAYKGAYHVLGISNGSNNVFIQLISLSVLIGGAYLVVNGSLSTGDMFVYTMIFGLLVSPVKRLMTMLETFQQGWAGFERFQELMDEKISIQEVENAVVLEEVKGKIEFKNVSFSYHGDKEEVLENFSLTIPSGKMIALVGPSGVGKTTIAQLVPRFYDAKSGEILIDGHEIKSLNLKSLRRHIGYIQQDVTLFWGTIAENIEYGRPGARREEIMEAAKKAGIHDFIASLPNGYESMVGERGINLSGGQKQRISIARIFLKDPKILILDEATSALDNITEAYIQESIEKLAVGRTVLVVAHRLSTIQRADQIVVMAKEGIVQSGTHAELIQKEGHYQRLYEASLNNFISLES